MATITRPRVQGAPAPTAPTTFAGAVSAMVLAGVLTGLILGALNEGRRRR